MRKILRFGVVLSVAYLTGTVGMAFGQGGAGGQVTRGAGAVVSPTQTPPPTTVGGLEQQAVQTTGIAPAGTNAPVPGQTVSPAAPAVGTTVPANTYQAPGTTGTVLNPAGAAVVNPPATTTYSSNYYAPGIQQPVYTQPGAAVTPGYTNRVMPGMAGYNNVNPMATTMAPGYYYAGTAGTPYTTGYSPMYNTPGYYSTQPQTYPVRQRRRLFGGLFQRRNRVYYPASPSTYGTSPYGYTTYGATTYTAPGTYVYSTSPY